MNRTERRSVALGFCLIYDGSQVGDIMENPINKLDDDFKWHMWRCEFVMVADVESDNSLDTEEKIEEFAKHAIMEGIRSKVGFPYNQEIISGLIERYFAY